MSPPFQALNSPTGGQVRGRVHSNGADVRHGMDASVEDDCDTVDQQDVGDKAEGYHAFQGPDKVSAQDNGQDHHGNPNPPVQMHPEC